MEANSDDEKSDRQGAREQRDLYLEMKRQSNPHLSFIPLEDLEDIDNVSKSIADNPRISEGCESNGDGFAPLSNSTRSIQPQILSRSTGPPNPPVDTIQRREVSMSSSNRSLPPQTLSRSLNSSSLSGPRKEAYACITQHEDTLDALFVGVTKGSLALWKSGSVINWIARMDGYPTRQHAMEAATALFKATTRWNQAMDGRVKFQYVTKYDDACFQLIYGGNRGNVLASAFFPDHHQNALNSLKVYDAQFFPQHKPFIVNTFLHEIGHILGLRHEHSHSGVPGWIPPEDRANGAESVVWGVKNPKSVMAYYKGQDIQESDVISIRKAYDELQDGKLITGQGRFGFIQKTVQRVLPNN